jgi:hypothetical protein
MIFIIIIGIIVLAGIIVGIIFLVGLAKQAWGFGGHVGKAVINVADQDKQVEKVTAELKKISKERNNDKEKIRGQNKNLEPNNKK